MSRHPRGGRRSAFPTPVGVKRAIVAEADDDLRMALKMLLEEDGFAVFTARSVAEALDHMSTVPTPDLIVADYLLPAVDGLGLIAHVRRQNQCARTPILLLTVAEGVSTRDPSVRILPKPIDIDGILSAVRDLTQRPDSSPLDEG